MKTITRDELNQQIDSDSDMALVEVLSPEYYEKFHLPGAVNVPINEEFDDKIQEVVPDKSKKVVVYCGNTECSASEKAAEHLDKLGYTEVYDYEAGKADWREAGLPTET